MKTLGVSEYWNDIKVFCQILRDANNAKCDLFQCSDVSVDVVL